MELERLTLYRVENANRTGLYRASELACDVLSESTRHPMPYADDGLTDYWDTIGYGKVVVHQFAFASLEQLKFWIYRASIRRALADAGLQVSVISAMGVAGDTQAVFLPETREDIEVLSLKEI